MHYSVSVYLCMFMVVCERVCVGEREKENVCVCVCVCSAGLGTPVRRSRIPQGNWQSSSEHSHLHIQ